MEKFERVLFRSTILIATQGEYENDRQPRHGAEAGARRGFGTAASMGIDIDELSELATDDLTEDGTTEWFKQFSPGAVQELRYCRDLVKGFDFVDH